MSHATVASCCACLRCGAGRMLSWTRGIRPPVLALCAAAPTPRHDLSGDRAQVPMRLAVKNTLFLLAGYATLLLVLAAFAVFQLLVLEARVQKDTARLFAREVAGALTEPSLDRLLQAD